MSDKVKGEMELLAPAGSREAFWAGVEAGADAIYLSPKMLNARAYCNNFSIEEIADLKETARKHGIRLYIALNSLMKENELKDCILLLAGLNEIGVDALIIQDLGILHIARRFFPDLKLHASTLMTIHNSLGVDIAGKMGFSRVVLARELTLDEIRLIAKRSRCEIEVFVHGAMCFSISGQCLFSSYFGGKASTRGRCVQPCRRLYRWKDKRGAFFSLHDLNALQFVHKLQRIGISSLKIEGRLKPPSYVYAVVKAYRQVLDATAENLKTEMVNAQEILEKASFGRPSCSGFFLSSNPGDIINPYISANTGLYLGKVVAAGRRNVVLAHRNGVSIEPGDRVRIVIRRKDSQISATVTKVDEGDCFTVELSRPIDSLASEMNGALVFKTDSAYNRLGRFDRTPDLLPDKTVRLKRAKRTAEKIWHEIGVVRTGRYDSGKKRSQDIELFVSVKSIGQLSNISMPKDVKGVFVELNRKNLGDARKGKLVRGLRGKLIWRIRPIVFERELKEISALVKQATGDGFRQFQVSNLSHLSLFHKNAVLFSSHHINALNSMALKWLRNHGIRYPHFSIETDLYNLKEAMRQFKGSPLVTVYGYIPLFTSRVRHGAYMAAPVISGKGEHFYWRVNGNVGELYPEFPVSFLREFRDLLNTGIFRWVLNLEYFPKKPPKHLTIPSSPTGLARRFRGRTFNLYGKLK